MKILLVGNGPRTNRGCEALSITTIELLRRNIPDVEIELFSFYPDVDRFYEDYLNVKVFPLTNKYEKPPLCWRFTNKIGYLPLRWQANKDELHPYVQRLVNADLVLSLGGDNYSDDYGGAELFWALGRWAKHFNKPFVIWGGSVGPFKTVESLAAAQAGLSDVAMVTAREDETVDYLKSIGYRGRVERVYDSAFLMAPLPAEIPNFNRAAPLVGFNISPIFHRYTGGRSESEVLTSSATFLRELMITCNVLLIPHVLSTPDRPGDEVYMAPLLELGEHVRLLPTTNNAQQLKDVISRCDFFVGARTHATIAAFSQGVPTLSLAYSMKAYGINRDLFDDDRFILAAEDYTSDGLVEKFAYLMAHRDEARNTLIAKQPYSLHMAERGMPLLQELLTPQ